METSSILAGIFMVSSNEMSNFLTLYVITFYFNSITEVLTKLL